MIRRVSLLVMMCVLGMGIVEAHPRTPKKPLGLYDTLQQCDRIDQGVTFSTLASWDDFYDAAACSRRTGRLWIIQFGFDLTLGQDVTANALAVKQRADAAGLSPYVVGVTYLEEWYALLKSGQVQLPLTFESLEVIRDFGGRQQGILKQIWNRPVIYVDTVVNEDKSFGVQWYQPLPPNTDVFGFEAYVPNGSTWDNTVGIYAQHFFTNYPSTSMLVIGQGFKVIQHNTMWSNGPTQESIDKTSQLVDNPRVLGLLMFAWQNRVGVLGMESLIPWWNEIKRQMEQ